MLDKVLDVPQRLLMRNCKFYKNYNKIYGRLNAQCNNFFFKGFSTRQSEYGTFF